MEINYHLPSFTEHYSLNLLIFDYMQEHPEYFRDGIKIASVFGNFPGALWNGGRTVPAIANPQFSKRVMEEYNKRGIPLRFTFTNPHITEKHLNDPVCNDILKMADNGLNQVIVMSPILEQYIRENYPNYKITSSTCKQIRDMDGVNAELDKDYCLVVLDYNWNNKFDELEKIKDKGRCEILINACCQPNCQRRGEHYSTIGKLQIERCIAARSTLQINRDNIIEEDFPCKYMANSIYDITDYSTYVSPEDIENKYVPMGFKHFKIEGRTTTDIPILETYVHYFVKPEFERKTRLALLKKLTDKIDHFNYFKE